MSPQTGYMQKKVSPLRKLHGKKVSAAEAQRDLFRQRDKALVKKNTPSLRSSGAAAGVISGGAVDINEKTLREKLRETRTHTYTHTHSPLAHLDFSSIRLAAVNNNNEDNNKNNNNKDNIENNKNKNNKPLPLTAGESESQSASSAHWLTFSSNENGMCSEMPSYSSFIVANECLQSLNSTDSFFFTGDQYQVFYKTFFNSDNCSGTNVTVETMPLGCVDGTQYAFSWESKEAAPLPPLGAYATYVNYGEEGCQGRPLSGDGILNNACLPNGETGSYKMDYPITFYYDNTNCIAEPFFAFNESTICTAGTVDDDYSIVLPSGQLELLSGAPYKPLTEPEGYLVLAYDLGEECTDVPDEINGFALDTCQIDVDLQTSYKFTCSDEYAYKYVYQSGDCDANTQTFIERFALGCETLSLDGLDTDFHGNYSLRAFCSEGASLLVPGNANYGINKNFEVNNCAGYPVSFYGYPENECLSPTENAPYSYKLEYPYFFEYQGLGCTGNGTIVDGIANSSECVSMSPYISSGDDNALGVQSVSSYFNQFPEGLYVSGTVVQGHAISSSSSSSLSLDSTGIAGIVVGAVIGCALLAGSALYMAIRRNKNKNEDELQLAENL